jgi:N-acetylmuramoyl-L-alanine amidase
MATYHTVKEGEYLVKIAQDYGFDDYRAIWDHPQNAELKLQRKSANAIYPGDKLFIPDKDSSGAHYATGRHHVILLRPKQNILRIVFKSIDGEPVTDTECALKIGSESYALVTNSNGLIAELIPKNATEGKLSILETEIPIQIGELDPVDTDTGQKVRLANLGYYLGPMDTDDEEQMKSAVEEFQCDQGLEVTGDCDAQSQAALKDAHGC